VKNQFKNDQRLSTTAALLTAILALGLLRAEGQSIQDPPFGRPDAVVDLASRDGIGLIKGQWRYHDVTIVDADSRAVGPDLKPSGAPSKTYDYNRTRALPNSTTRSGMSSMLKRSISVVQLQKSASTGTG